MDIRSRKSTNGSRSHSPNKSKHCGNRNKDIMNRNNTNGSKDSGCSTNRNKHRS